ncbi:hypothetical protein DFJ73DRAFT_171736 [Zopfochytrium polystomum]|nr:hypothetical protein DFJ73DRAFT_171736 [Zopfochytrium polystomum]
MVATKQTNKHKNRKTREEGSSRRKKVPHDMPEQLNNNQHEQQQQQQPSTLLPVDGFATPHAHPVYAPSLVLVPIRTFIFLDVDIKNRSATGRVRHWIRNSTAHPAVPSVEEDSGLLLLLTQSITFNAVSLDIRGVSSSPPTAGPVSFVYDGSELKVTWESPFAPNELRFLDIEYSVTNPIAGLYFSVPDDKHPDRGLHCATDHETERARYWLPCVDFPAVRTSLEFYLTHDAQLTALANGTLFAVKPNPNGTKTTCYRLDRLCPSYLICFAIGDFVQYNDQPVDGMPISYFATKEYTKEQLALSLGRTPAMIRWLKQRVGVPFPWPKYHQLFSPFIGGAMENISLVTHTDRLLVDEIRAKEAGWSTDLTNIHEMGHTYFGDLVVTRHFEHAWLKESWATYIAACWQQDNVSADEFRLAMIKNAISYFDECEKYIRPIVCRTYDSSWDLFDRHTYPGGAWRIHMLRHILGESAFWAAVTTYLKRFTSKTVETEDFKRCLEEASSLNLTPFFDQWIYSPGFPKIKAAYTYHSDTRLVEVSLTQTQSTEGKAAAVPAVFEFTIEVHVIDADGAVFKGKATFSQKSGSRSATAFVPMGSAKPVAVEIDPRGKILHQLDFTPGEEILASTAKKGIDVGNRIHAYEELIKKGSSTSMRKVSELLAGEPFFGVRERVYAALGRSKSAAAIAIIARSLRKEQNIRALNALLPAASMRDPAIREGLISILERPVEETAYQIRAVAYENLGRQRDVCDVERLLVALHDPREVGFLGAVRSGVLRGLAHTGTAAAHAALVSVLGGRDVTTRTLGHEYVYLAAISALATSASDGFGGATSGEEIRRLRRDAAEIIADVTIRAGDGVLPLVREQGINSLAALGAVELLGEIRVAVETRFAAQYQHGLAAVLRRLQLGGGGGGQALDVSRLLRLVEELDDKVKRLEKEVESARVSAAGAAAAASAAAVVAASGGVQQAHGSVRAVTNKREGVHEKRGGAEETETPRPLPLPPSHSRHRRRWWGARLMDALRGRNRSAENGGGADRR